MAEQNIKPPLPPRPTESPAPQLTKHGRCSDCNVTAVIAGNGDYKVCPQCYGVLWCRDWSGEERKKREAAAAAMAAARTAAVEARLARAAELRKPTELMQKKEDEP